MQNPVPIKAPAPVKPERKPPSSDWLEAVRTTIERVRATGKKTGAPETITNKMVEAVEKHDPSNGNIVVVDVGENCHLFLGITIQ